MGRRRGRSVGRLLVARAGRVRMGVAGLQVRRPGCGDSLLSPPEPVLPHCPRMPGCVTEFVHALLQLVLDQSVLMLQQSLCALAKFLSPALETLADLLAVSQGALVDALLLASCPLRPRRGLPGVEGLPRSSPCLLPDAACSILPRAQLLVQARAHGLQLCFLHLMECVLGLGGRVHGSLHHGHVGACQGCCVQGTQLGLKSLLRLLELLLEVIARLGNDVTCGVGNA
mmetsp:Transcript_109961/g.310806  ORF Transcript_109961/g.310806 Transcript_109961/m.310806 type:complete len:228 (-) Transcript_109961:483-1166(-)